jgi:ABC-type multidrug transport system permease subunit
MRRFGLTRAIALEHLRDSSYSIWVIVMPTLGYAAAAIFLGDGTPAKAGTILGAALLLSTCVWGNLNFPLGLRALADAGLERRMVLWPVSRRSFILSAVASDAFTALGACAPVLVLGMIFGVSFSDNLPIWVVGILFAITSSMACGGALFATGADFTAIKNYGNLLFMLLALASGVFFKLPGNFIVIQEAFPTYHLAVIFSRAAGTETRIEAWNWLVPAVWTAACLAYSLTRSAKRRPADA